MPPLNCPDGLPPLFGTSGCETSIQLVGPGPEWSVGPREIIFKVVIMTVKYYQTIQEKKDENLFEMQFSKK